ncbi:YtcA family lipoprotein [Acetobacter orientalis]|uniref:YtcA family lipoprotein n=1 Tax=Acetobacter orientalis TaxID=146474 RepID=UPI00241FB063|nr:YtcA family lipoprotein [Acetobacter orientalis]
MSRFRTLIPLLPGLLCLAGCTTHHAPSFALMGAYFPSWMLCGSIGILIAIGARFLFIALGLDALLSLRLFTYVSLGVSAALLVWLIWFGA